MQRAYKFALLPTFAVEQQFNSHAGGVRYAYNWALTRYGQILDQRDEEKAATGKAVTPSPTHFGLAKEWTAYKDQYEHTPDPATGFDVHWVGNNFVGSYQAAVRDAVTAWKNFWDSRNGARKGRPMGRPRYKSKHRTAPSFQMHGTTLRMVDQSHVKQINLPKIGPVTIPAKSQIGGRVDRNNRIARSLTRALRKGDTTCPTCAATPGLMWELRRNPDDKTKLIRTQVVCGDCRVRVTAEDGTKTWVATLRVPVCRVVRATISRGASGTWWSSVTAAVVMDTPGRACDACTSGKVIGVNDAGAEVMRDCPVCKGTAWRPTPNRRQASNGLIGLDLGTQYLAVDSDGTIYPNPEHLQQSLAELKIAQQALARTQPDSRRREKARLRVGAIHERTALLRKDSADRVTTQLAHTYAGVAVEGWDAQQVAEQGDPTVPKKVRRRRNRQLADAAPGIMRWQVEYKTSWSGASFHKGAKTQKTGRTCSVCWTERTNPIPLTDVLFRCQNPACGNVMDRRVNSARVVRGGASGQNRPGGAPAPPTKPRGEGVRPEASRRGRRSPVKRVAPSSRSPDRLGHPDAELAASGVPTQPTN